MLDREWIKSLATADFSSHRWQEQNEEAVKQRAAHEVALAMEDIYRYATEAIEVFNTYSSQQREIKVIPLHKGTPPQLCGLVLMVGSTQLRLDHESYRFTVTLIKTRTYRSSSRLIHILEPRIDPFGGLTWIMDRKVTLTRNLIIQQLLRDICIGAFAPAAGSSQP